MVSNEKILREKCQQTTIIIIIFRRNENAAKVRNKQVWDTSDIIY